MMLLALLSGLALGFVGSIPVAGPTAVVVVEAGLANRSREGLEVAIGAAVAESLYALMAFWGLSAAFSRYPMILPASRAVGSAVLILVGLYFVYRRPTPGKPQDQPARKGHRWLFGFSITAFNPTLAVTWTAAVAALHSALSAPFNPSDAIPFAAGAGVGIVAWFWLLLKLVRKFNASLKPSTMDRLIRGMGGGLVMLGVFLAGRSLLLLAH